MFKLLLILAATLIGQVLYAQEIPRFSCLMTNHPYQVLDAKTHKPVDHDENWQATCTVTYKNEKVYSGRLPLPLDSTQMEASAAVEDFRKHKLPEILKSLKK